MSIGGSDPSKIMQLFDKIEKSNNLEIEERSLKNIAQKIQNKLLDISYLVNNHPEHIKTLIKWLQTRFQQTNQSGLLSCISIFRGIASKTVNYLQNFKIQIQEGKSCLLNFGTLELLDNYQRSLQDNPSIQKEIQDVIKMLVNDSSTANNTTLGYQQSFQQQPKQNFSNDVQKQNSLSFSQSMISQPNQFSSQVMLSNIPEREEDPSFNIEEQHKHIQSQMSQNPFSQSKSAFNKTEFKVSATVNINKDTTLQQRNNQNEMEIKVKQQLLKETCELPFVWLNEEDERFLFDLGVQLKFGDFKNILNATQKFQNLAIFDFPVEVFLQRTDIIRALLDLLEGAQGSQFTNLAQPALMKFVQRLRTIYPFLTDPNNKVSHMPQNDRDVIIPLEPHLEHTYPCNHNGRWAMVDQQQDMQKFGVSQNYILSSHNVKIQNMSAAALQNSLSCRAALGLILTKTINLLKDKEKIGLYYQLINETIDTMLQIYRVKENDEFSNFIHLCLFAFDSVCQNYKEQIFEDILLRPMLDIIIKFLDILNYIPQTEKKGCQSFTECLYENTQNLQITLRRAIFKFQFNLDTEEGKFKQQTILVFFRRLEEDLAHLNIVKQDVAKHYERAYNAFKLFQTVQTFKFNTQGLLKENESGIVFIETTMEYYQTLTQLENLEECIEMKLDFPFEHLLVDCIMYGMLAEDTSIDPKLDKVEQIFKNYLIIPLPEVRERIIRKIYQKIRIQQSFSANKQQFNNIALLAKFLYRKQVLNQLINGILINDQIANEQSKIQMTIGQVLVKILVSAYNEGGFISSKNNLNNHFLTFHSLLQEYPDLIGLIDLIEENSNNKQIRYNRLLRDIFNQNELKRQFATSVLRNNMSKDSQDHHINDMIKDMFDLKNPAVDLNVELDYINQSFDFSSFDFPTIMQLLMSSNQDYQIKKQCMEQLTLVLFDVTSKKGKQYLKNDGQVQDLFNYIVSEILGMYNTCTNFLRQQVSLLEMVQVQYLNDCIRFLLLVYLIYFDEKEVKTFFDKFRNLLNFKDKQDETQQKYENFQNAMLFFMGSGVLRKNATRLLQIILFHQVFLSMKLVRQQSINGTTKKQLTIYIPEFIQNSFIILLPTQSQAIRMPLRNDILLTEEQKMYIQARLQQQDMLSLNKDQLLQVTQRFIEIASDKNQNFNSVMKIFEELQNHILGTQQIRDELINPQMAISLIDLIKILPTRDFEYSFLADYFMIINQILQSHQRFDQHVHNLDMLIARLCEGLQYHLIPYLLETVTSYFTELENVQPEHNYSHKLHFIHRFLELINSLVEVDLYLKRKFRIKSSVQEKLLTNNFIEYLFELFAVLKNQPENKRKILIIFTMIISQYDIRNLEIEKLPELLISFIATHKQSQSLKLNSLLFLSIRTLIIIHDRRLMLIKQHNNNAVDISVSINLSQTSQKYLSKYQSFGWLIRLTETRDSRLRCLAWDLLCELFDYEFLKNHPTLIQTALNTFLKHQELYSVKISVLKFLNHVCDQLIHNCDMTIEEGKEISESQFIGSQPELVSVQSLLKSINKHGLISQVHNMLAMKDSPLMFITLTLKFLHKLVQMDYKRALPVLTQLDYWTFLVDYINIQQLKDLENNENRLIIQDLKQNLLRISDPTAYQDSVYLCINSILEFLYEAFKRDQQLANLLVKTTKMMTYLFELIKQTVDNYNQKALKLQNEAILALFIDKCCKLMHCALLHPRDYTVDLLKKFLFEKTYISHQFQPRNWIYIIEFYQIVNNISQKSAIYGTKDIKLAITRFIAEFLLRLPQTCENYLDEMIEQYEGENYFKVNDNSDLIAYGGKLLVEMGMIFKQIYSDKQQSSNYSYNENTDDQENQRVDITTCLSILLAKSQQAKTMATEQNLIKKVIEICKENHNALILQDIQKTTKKKQQIQNKSILGKSTINNSQMVSQVFENQIKRTFKYVNPNDITQCEREVLRMLQILRHTFYDSQQLLIPILFSKNDNQSISQSKMVPALNKSVKTQEEGTGTKLIQLIQTLFEDQTQNYEIILQETYMTSITFASQNVRFKNAFINSSINDPLKKRSLIKVITESLLRESIQSNSKLLKLNFTLLRTLSMSSEIAKELTKLKLIEDILSMITPQCKNEKDIKLMKYYLSHFSGFLAAYASTEEGQKILLKLKPLFDQVLFVLDTITVQNQSSENKITMSIFTNNLLFLRNISLSRTVKPHFLSNENFLPCLLSFLSHQNNIPRIKAYSTACLWMILFNHQGVKAILNRPEVVSELQLLRQEYQRQSDISNYSHYVEQDNDSKPNTQIIKSSQGPMIEAIETKRMNDFTLHALNGILKLLNQK